MVGGKIGLAERDRTRIRGLVWGAQVLGEDSESDSRGRRKIKVFPKSQNPFKPLLAVCGVFGNNYVNYANYA